MSKSFDTLVDDVNFVIAEIERLQGPNRTFGPWDGMCWIPGPNGGHRVIGREAERRVDRMVIAALAWTPYGPRVDATRVKTEFKAALAELLAKGTIDGPSIQRALAKSVKRAAKDCKARSHFFPAHLMQLDKPAPFAVGNVHFWPSKKFVEELHDDFAAMVVASSSGGRPLHKAQEIADEAADYYLAFGWVIGVKIEGCDAVIAQERAKQCAVAAAHIIRLLGSDRGAQRMTIGGPRAKDTREAHLWKVDDRLEWRLMRSTLGSAQLETWLEWIAWPENQQVMQAAAACLEALRDPSRDWPVALRWIDAVTWFGEAVQDASDAAAVIKFVTAIERMVMTGNKGDKVYATFCRRAGAVAYSLGDDLIAREKEAAEIYDARSRLAHGSLSPFDPEVRLMRHQAGEFARTVLISAGAFLYAFGHVAQPTTVKQLGKVWEGLAEAIAADGGAGLFAPDQTA